MEIYTVKTTEKLFSRKEEFCKKHILHCFRLSYRKQQPWEVVTLFRVLYKSEPTQIESADLKDYSSSLATGRTSKLFGIDWMYNFQYLYSFWILVGQYIHVCTVLKYYISVIKIDAIEKVPYFEFP